MKKRVLTIALAIGVAGAFAQDLTSKKGEPILPESGDWAISWDAAPFLTYVGGFMSNAGATAPTANWVNVNQTIIGKRFTDAKMAQRALLRIGLNSMSSTRMIGDASVTTAPTYPALPAMKEDKMTTGSRFVGIGAGMEWRRGKTRLQGFYGGDAMLYMSGGSSKYEYGNALSATVPVSGATTSNFGNNLVSDTYGNSARVLKEKTGGTFGIGVRGFIGAEYFIFPKIAIGAEYGWGIGFSRTGASERELESVNAGTTVGSQTIETVSKSSNIMLDTDINGWGSGTGKLLLTVHF